MDKNNETLLKLLNHEFGFPDAQAAHYKKIKQYYNERKNQHIIFIELRISRNEKPIERDSDYNNNQRLLYGVINAKRSNKK